MEDCVKRNLIRQQLVVALLVMFASGFAMPRSAQAQLPDFPYQGIVATEGAKVYSGPGDMHYATEQLSAGAVVEVYRHDPGGWCAIRPTSDSFSLLPQSAVVIVSKDVGEVTEDGLQAWVGTTLGPVENPLWQIKLRSGERVKLLGEISWPEPNGESTSWYQVAPPNGEFRWIHLDDIKLPVKQVPNEFENENTIAQTMVGGQSPAARQQPAANQGWRPAKQPRTPVPNSGSSIQVTSGIQQEDNQQLNRNISSFDRLVANPTSAPVRTPTADSFGAFDEQADQNGFVSPQVDPQQFAVQPFTSQQDFAPQSPAVSQNIQRPDRFASADSAFGEVGIGQSNGTGRSQTIREIQPLGSAKLSRRLRDLDMRLSAEVVKQDYDRWQLQDIGLDVQRIANAPVDISERVAAERLLNKINNFRQIQENARLVKPENLNSGLGPSSQNLVGTGVANNGTTTENIYDAQGWLNELVRNRGSLDSTYVLQDANGQITHHVQPAPGLNLHRYLRSKVGIIGPRGFNQRLSLDHVVAERIIVLQKPAR